MSRPSNGGSAFPEPGVYDASREQINPVGAYYDAGGMTVRQAYKMAAIKGITANQYFFGATYQGTPEGALDFATRLADLAIAEDAEFEARKS